MLANLFIIMAQSDEAQKELSDFTEFTIIYSKLKSLENKIKLDKKEVNQHDLNQLNIFVHSLEKKFKSYYKTHCQSK